jgi:hypothetical protein
MNPRDLWHRKSGWERVPDVVSNLPRVLNSSLTAVDAARTALDSTMSAVDAAKSSPPMKPEKSGGLSPIRGGLLLVGSALVIGLGSAAVSSARRRDTETDQPS